MSKQNPLNGPEWSTLTSFAFVIHNCRNDPELINKLKNIVSSQRVFEYSKTLIEVIFVVAVADQITKQSIQDTAQLFPDFNDLEIVDDILFIFLQAGIKVI